MYTLYIVHIGTWYYDWVFFFITPNMRRHIRLPMSVRLLIFIFFLAINVYIQISNSTINDLIRCIKYLVCGPIATIRYITLMNKFRWCTKLLYFQRIHTYVHEAYIKKVEHLSVGSAWLGFASLAIFDSAVFFYCFSS